MALARRFIPLFRRFVTNVLCWGYRHAKDKRN